MFRRHKFFKLIVLMLLFFGFSGMISRSRTQNAWMAGYYAGIQADQNSDGVAPNPSAPFHYGNRGFDGFHGRHYGGSIFAPILSFAAIAFIMMLFFKFMFGGMMWRRHMCGHRGKWHGEHDSPFEKQPEDIDPEIRQA